MLGEKVCVKIQKANYSIFIYTLRIDLLHIFANFIQYFVIVDVTIKYCFPEMRCKKIDVYDVTSIPMITFSKSLQNL